MTAHNSKRDEAELQRLLTDVRACTLCAAHLPLGPLPVVRGSLAARIMIISQAPGTAVHKTGLSFNDPSGDRLRNWLDVDRNTFYDEQRFAMLPMGFCYPGRFERGGDRPPRLECAPLWHDQVRAAMPSVELNLVVGSYAINQYLASKPKRSMTDTVAAWRDYLPDYLPLPHPSWRTTAWERKNPWFMAEVVPELRARVLALI
ncbi:MAG: uracil-DNA glycosylase [Alphaproteobacteria bacterium]|jgi:uracil-DNA glycosylase